MLTRLKESAGEERYGEASATAAGYPTPGEVFGEIGLTVAAFLAIALLANLLAMFLGA